MAGAPWKSLFWRGSTLPQQKWLGIKYKPWKLGGLLLGSPHYCKWSISPMVYKFMVFTLKMVFPTIKINYCKWSKYLPFLCGSYLKVSWNLGILHRQLGNAGVFPCSDHLTWKFPAQERHSVWTNKCYCIMGQNNVEPQKCCIVSCGTPTCTCLTDKLHQIGFSMFQTCWHPQSWRQYLCIVWFLPFLGAAKSHEIVADFWNLGLGWLRSNYMFCIIQCLGSFAGPVLVLAQNWCLT